MIQFRNPDSSEDRENDVDLDRDFPLGDGTAEDEATVVCPHCSQRVTIALDAGSGALQEYVEDCEVCCNPWQVRVAYRDDGSAEVSVTPL